MKLQAPMPPHDPDIAALLHEHRRQGHRRAAIAVLALGIVLAALAYAGIFDWARYHGTARTILQMASDAWPPDFSRLRHWGRPLLETLSMSIGGTALGLAAALPLGAVAARNVCPAWVGAPVVLLLHAARSIPSLLWGILFVAAVGFGPLPGALALACQSAGVLGKFFAETLEHADPAPAEALLSQGVSRLGVLRFAVLEQVLPFLVDFTLYRWEHNLRAATTLGIVGAGGLGLEIITAFHLFEYREALALILLVLMLVTLINLGGAWLRSHLAASLRR